MSFKSSKLFSIVKGTCPRCHQGNMFVNKNPYKIEGWDKMHENCSVCNLHYEREPGFFQGAMYVSYALGVGLSIAVVIANFLISFNPVTYFVSNTIAIVLLAPLLFRWSRGIYLNIFISYDKSKDIQIND